MKVNITYPKTSKEKGKCRVYVHHLDLWDMSTTIAKMVYPMLVKYRALYDKEGAYISFPMEFSCDPLKNPGPDNPDRLPEWLAILDKMIYSFKCLNDPKIGWDGPAHEDLNREIVWEDNLVDRVLGYDPLDIGTEDWDKHQEFWLKHHRPIFEKYEVIFDAHRAQVQEGIDLFAKYFRSLNI